MKKTFLLVFLILIFTTIFSFYSCSKSNDSSGPDNTGIVQIGLLTVDPGAIIVNQANQLVVRLNVPFGVNLSDSSIVLAKVDNNNNKIAELGKLYDNGILANADEIKGDNIFSGKININEASVGAVRLAGFAKAGDKQGISSPFVLNIYADLASGAASQVLKIQKDGVNQLNTYLGGNINNLSTATEQLKNWLLSQPGVASVEKSTSTNMLINYSSGLKGGIVVTVNDATGKKLTRGGVSFDDKPRQSTATIPLSKQTRGETISNFNITNQYYKSFALPANRVGNRNVLIYAPFESVFAPHNESDEVIERLNQASCKGFSITHLSNTQANIAAVENMTNYGYIIIATHGSLGKEFATGEYFDSTSEAYKTKYKALWQAKKLAVWTQVVVGINGQVEVKKDIWAIDHTFISGLTGTFPNSIVLNNSCESAMNPDLQNAFIGKGAKTYYGYTKNASSSFAVMIADSLTKRLAVDNLNTGQAFFNAEDPNNPNSFLQIKGATDMLFLTDLTNGDFETGTMEGWTKKGDGRVISQLGSQQPTQGKFMGIISSGLGYTTSAGSLFQCVTIPANASKLTLKWNFFSEEFLEYIGSQYQDYFRIYVKRPDGTEVDLYRRAIDGFAADFGATKTNPGSLIRVSPAIVFDKGDVYMTGWQSREYDITAFRGSTIVIVFAIGDVGDSIYDSACLLDEIKIQ